jgi:hypothetical protein
MHRQQNKLKIKKIQQLTALDVTDQQFALQHINQIYSGM